MSASSVSFKKKRKTLPREIAIHEANKQKSGTDHASIDGSRELIDSGLILAESFHVGKYGTRTISDKAKEMKIRMGSSHIKQSENAVRTGKKLFESDVRGKERDVKQKKMTSKEKFRKLRFSTVMNKLLLKIHTNRGQEESGIKRTVQTFLIGGMAGIVGHIVLTALPVLLVIMLLYNSPFALFMPELKKGENIREVLAGYYQEFNQEIDEETQRNGTTITYAGGQSGISNFRDVLMVYMVKYYTGTGEIGTVVTDKAKENLRTVFDEMNYFKNETTTRTIRTGESLGQVVTSGYCSCSICCGQWAGGPTASGVMPTPNHTLAVDANTPFVPIGTKVLLNGREYTVEDTGDFARFGVQFDVYCADHTTAQNWGHQSFECYLASGNVQEIEVSTNTVNVYHLTYEEYIADGNLTEEQTELLRKMMTSDIWGNFSDGTIGSMVATEALTKVGCAYDQNRRYEEGFYDCSSLVERLYRDVAGINLPTTAATQGKYCYESGRTVTADMLQPGDLIFYSYEENGRFMNISHVAIYVGNNRMVHAANPSRGVVYDPFRTSNLNLYGRPY